MTTLKLMDMDIKEEIDNMVTLAGDMNDNSKSNEKMLSRHAGDGYHFESDFGGDE